MKNALEVKVGVVENAEEFIKEQQKEVEKASEFTDKIAEQIRANRLKVIPKLKSNWKPCWLNWECLMRSFKLK